VVEIFTYLVFLSLCPPVTIKETENTQQITKNTGPSRTCWAANRLESDEPNRRRSGGGRVRGYPFHAVCALETSNSKKQKANQERAEEPEVCPPPPISHMFCSHSLPSENNGVSLWRFRRYLCRAVQDGRRNCGNVSGGVGNFRGECVVLQSITS